MVVWMDRMLIDLAGWIPAIVLPAATISQLIKILRVDSVSGVSLVSWILFGLANIGLYIFTEKYFVWQSIIGLLFTALLDFVIVALVIYKRR